MRLKIFRSIVLLYLSVSSAFSLAAKRCEEAFAGTPTQEFLSYLDAILEQDLIPKKDWHTWGELLHRGQLTNPLEKAQQSHHSGNIVHAEGMDYFLQQNLDIETVNQWFLENMSKLKTDEIDKFAVAELTVKPFSKIKFHRIEPGTFTQIYNKWRYARVFYKRKVTLTHPFELMETVLTQAQYLDIVKGGTPILPEHRTFVRSWNDVARLANAYSNGTSLSITLENC